jgi:hypothetical protein
MIHRSKFLRKYFIRHFEALPRNPLLCPFIERGCHEVTGDFSPMDFSRSFEMTVACHSEALTEESCALPKILPLHFIQCQNDTNTANKIIIGIRKISEFPKFKNRVKIRILPENTRKNIF